MLQVITGLGLKFDTTAVALSLSMVLMFVHFFADRAETALLTAVDCQVESELAEYLPAAPAGAGRPGRGHAPHGRGHGRGDRPADRAAGPTLAGLDGSRRQRDGRKWAMRPPPT